MPTMKIKRLGTIFLTLLALILYGIPLNSFGKEHMKIVRNPNGEINFTATYNWVSGRPENGLTAVRYGTRFFHICGDGYPAYEETYDWASNFFSGFAAVKKDNREFHIRPDGTPAYEARFDHIGLFRDGIAHVWQNKEEFYINTDGERVTDKYIFVTSFLNNVAHGQKKDGAWEIINMSDIKIKKGGESRDLSPLCTARMLNILGTPKIILE